MTDTTTHPGESVALDIGGMTCASCAARITKRLNKLEGVDATVNYATEQATVTIPEGVTVDELVAEVEAIGYTLSAILRAAAKAGIPPAEAAAAQAAGRGAAAGGCAVRNPSPVPWPPVSGG